MVPRGHRNLSSRTLPTVGPVAAVQRASAGAATRERRGRREESGEERSRARGSLLYSRATRWTLSLVSGRGPDSRREYESRSATVVAAAARELDGRRVVVAARFLLPLFCLSILAACRSGISAARY